MRILEAFLEAIAAAFATMLFFGGFIVSLAQPIVNGLISFVTKVPATEDQTKAVVFVILVLMTFVPLINRLNRKKTQTAKAAEKPKRKGMPTPTHRVTDDGELEEIVEEL